MNDKLYLVLALAFLILLLASLAIARSEVNDGDGS